MIIRKREYNDLLDTIERRRQMIDNQRKIYEERLDKYREEITEHRRILRKIHKLITDERQKQNYKSVENVLNKLETEITKIESGE